MKNSGNPTADARRGLAALTLLLALPFVFCCGGSSDSTTPPPARPTVTPTSTAAAADLVRISGGEGVRSDLVRVDFSIGGPTTSSDIVNIGFDVVMSDPELLTPSEYAPGTLFPTDDPDAPVTVVGSPSLNDDRITVAVQKLTGPDGTGDGAGAGGAALLSVTFVTHKKGSTTLKLENGVAYDSAGDPIASISFDSATATVTQP